MKIKKRKPSASRTHRFFATVQNFLRDIGAGYTGATHTRNLKQWHPSTQGPDQEILRDLPTLRARSRDLFKNNTIGRGAIRTLCTNVIGTGLKLNSNIDREFLGLTDQQADKWESDVERRFSYWADTSECDAARKLNFAEIQELAYLTKLQSGDSFAVLPLIPRTNSLFLLRVKLIEADRVQNPFGTANRDNIRAGIKINQNDEPISYFIRTSSERSDVRHIEVPAFGEQSGRPNVLHLYKQERPGQSRGVPLLAPVLEAIKQLGRYKDSELVASVVSSFYTVFIKSNNPDALDDPQRHLRTQSEEFEDEEDKLDYTLSPGAVYQLRDGEEIEQANPMRPNPNYKDFIDAGLQDIAMGLEIPKEILAKQFMASFSASRAARLEFWKFVTNERNWFSRKFCQAIYCEWLMDEILRGNIMAPGFIESIEKRMAWSSAEWIGDGMGQINEVVSVKAATERINAGFTTRQTEIKAINGGDFKKIVRQLRKEKSIMDEVIEPVTKEAPQPEKEPQPAT